MASHEQAGGTELAHEPQRLSAQSGRAAFITDPTLLRKIEGWSYVVLRPNGQVADVYAAARGLVETADIGGAYVASPHVTLLEVPPGADMGELSKAAKLWAKAQEELSLATSEICMQMFGAKVAAIEVRASMNLTRALKGLRQLAASVGVAHTSTISADEWRFHMTIMSYEERGHVGIPVVHQQALVERISLAKCRISSAELVTYRHGCERSLGVFPLEGNRVDEGPQHAFHQHDGVDRS